MERASQRELLFATRIADALVYTVGVAGVVAGGLLLRNDSLGFAIVAWVLTFVAGASLRLASTLTRALADIKKTLTRLEERLTGAPPPTEARHPDQPPDPYRRWGGWH